MKDKIVIYEAKDRRGKSYFLGKPTYHSGFDIFEGKRVDLPKNRKSYRLVRIFKTKVTGLMAEDGIYPKEIKVGE